MLLKGILFKILIQTYPLLALASKLATNADLAASILPSELPPINEAMDVLSDEFRNMFLVNYFNDLYI